MSPASNGGSVPMTPAQVAAYNHARFHDLSVPIRKCWLCKRILAREGRR